MEKIVDSTKKDLKNIAKCHISSFPKALSSALGKKYVSHMLSWYLSSDKTFLFHIEDEQGNCAGYCGGIVSDGTLATGSASGMAQYTFKAAITAFLTHPWVLFHPEIRAKWPLLWKNIKMKIGLAPKVHFNQDQKKKMAQDPQVGLVVIGVDPRYQGKGYGSLLLKEFERRAVEIYGIKKLQLSVLASNHKAIKAYERNGWKFDKQNGKSVSMIKILE
ncbi:hypothetical protein JCM31826_08180 [Thermaurantimonas aggregans]|uniref:N-acetyltransferase domain-containing protein n=1 Tax=Thermaurantimonas aggregans TaxID=2173829 RepID=A0A401XJZ0_9FLAO|nr:GNAT family N-acetyltransferase [Thermaurantimonas aggregans]MCX8148596.1 GNAT family N-acetyltransferase [Thermaurantimonas aggregans]GCD77336.1 hypothetical protein JCM31826_08180 [Thermaurantimonas aggregans]